MHISKLANWLVDVQIVRQANSTYSRCVYITHILHIVARVQHTHTLHAIYIYYYYMHTLTHIHDCIALMRNKLNIAFQYRNGSVAAVCYCCFSVFFYFNFLFSTVTLWHIMACDFGTAVCLCVHDNRFSTMSRSL